jgi:hypothetical protein
VAKEVLERHGVRLAADTLFRRRARLHQAPWRERMGYPMGNGHGKPRGDRLAMPWAQETLANYLTPTIQRVVARELAAATDARGLGGGPRGGFRGQTEAGARAVRCSACDGHPARRFAMIWPRTYVTSTDDETVPPLTYR